MTGKWQTQCEGEAKQLITVLIIKSVIMVYACFKLIIKCEKMPANMAVICGVCRPNQQLNIL